MKCIFLGPTGRNISNLTLSTFSICPPVKRGDCLSIIQSHEPGLMVIVDGNFHQCLAVAHKEIILSIEAGWEVWGVSSMGAIRAAELNIAGMHGYGDIYERYKTDPDYRDDEVTLLHETCYPYRAVSEPMIHLQFALNELTAQKLLTKKEAMEVAGELRSMWFGDRNWNLMKTLIFNKVNSEIKRNKIVSILENKTRFQKKQFDLTQFLESTPWEYQ